MVMLKGSSAIDARLPEGKKLVERQPEFLREIAEITAHHFARESVVPRRHRRVRGENIGRGHDLERGVEIEILLRAQNANPLEREEGGVAFVHVEDVRVDPERAERAHAADAEDHLLADAHFQIAAVKLGRDEAIFRRVLGHVGIEQVKT